MNVSEASRRLGISRSTVYQLVGAGKITHYRIGGRIIFFDEDIAAFLAGCRVTAAPTETINPTPRLKLKHISLGRGS